MSATLDPQLKRALAERIRYYNELGIYDFYRREAPVDGAGIGPESSASTTIREIQPEQRDQMTPRTKAAVAVPIEEAELFEVANPRPESRVADPAKALRIIREDL